MSIHSEIRKQLYDYYRGELNSQERKEVEAHVRICDECSGEAEAIKYLVQSAPVCQPSDERPPEYWRLFISNVEQKIQLKGNGKTSISILGQLISQIRYYPKSTVAFATSFILIIVSLVLWKINYRAVSEAVPDQQLPQTSELTESDKRVADYFRKSKTLLIGISNMDLDAHKPVNLTAEQNVSRELVREARSIQRQPIDIRSAKLVGDLERILIELANSKERNDIPDIEMIRNGIKRENLLFKIRMAEPMYETPRFVQTNHTLQGDRR